MCDGCGAGIGGAHRLTRLCLHNNSLTHLPVAIGSLEHLESLDVYGRIFVPPPPLSLSLSIFFSIYISFFLSLSCFAVRSA